MGAEIRPAPVELRLQLNDNSEHILKEMNKKRDDWGGDLENEG